MKKIIILFLIIFILSSTVNIYAGVNSFDDGGGGGTTYPDNDTEKPVIHLSQTSATIEAIKDDYIPPECYVTDNKDQLNCIKSGIVNDDVPGTYRVSYNAIDLSGNRATTKYFTVYVSDYLGPEYCNLDFVGPLTPGQRENCTNYNHNLFDDYTFYGSATLSGNLLTVPISDVKYTDDSCSVFGDDHVFLRDDNEHIFIEEIPFSDYNVRYDFYSEDGKYFYDYRYSIFGSKYNVYKVFKECQQLTTFDNVTSLPSDFQGIIIWNYRYSASIDNYNAAMKSRSYVERMVYISPEALNYYDEIFMTIPINDSTEMLQNLLNTQVSKTAILSLYTYLAYISGAELVSSLNSLKDYNLALAALTAVGISNYSSDIYDEIVDSLYDSSYNNIIQSANNDGKYGYDVGILFVQNYQMIIGDAYQPGGVYRGTEMSLWNVSSGVERFNGADFGVFTVIPLEELEIFIAD